MCDECEALRQEFAEDIIRRRLRLKPGEARLVCWMYRDGIYNTDTRNENTTTVLIHRIRKILGKTLIETVPNEGYRLSTDGREKVAQALELAA